MSDNKKDRIKFLSVLFAGAVAFCLYYFEGKMNAQNTTAYVINYKYGIVPRGFVGSVIYLLDKLLPFNLYNYAAFMVISLLVTCFFFLLLFWMYDLFLREADQLNIQLVKALIIFLSVFVFPEFWTWNNFGRLDEYLTIITVLCIILIVASKAEWLIPILCVIACLVHVGFVFTNVALILVLLFYKAVVNEGSKKKYYYTILIITFICVSTAFLYLEVFIDPQPMSVYREIVALAKSCSSDGQSISDSLLDSEILGKDVYSDEWVWRQRNLIEFPLFLVAFSPFIVWGVKFIFRLIKNAEDKKDKIVYFVMCFGIGTIIPSLVLKVDYGRWMFCIIFYYLVMTISLVVLGDTYFITELQTSCVEIKNKVKFYPVIFIYPLLFMPFRDVYISDITTYIMNTIAHIAGLW